MNKYEEEIKKAHIDRAQAIAKSFQSEGEDTIQKGKAATVGEIREWGGKKYKKQPNGKWVEVSEHGMTKKEHQKETNDLLDKQLKNDNTDTRIESERSYNKWKDKNLSDKEHDESELSGGDKFDHTFFDDYKLDPVERQIINDVKNGLISLNNLTYLHDNSSNIDQKGREYLRKFMNK